MASRCLGVCLDGEAYNALSYWGAVHRSTILEPVQSTVATACAIRDFFLHGIVSGYLACYWATRQTVAFFTPLLTATWQWALHQSDWLPQTIIIIVAVTILWQTYYPSRLLLSLFRKVWPDITWDFRQPSSTPGKFVALTINGGPCYMNTPKLLNLLEERDAKATFFILGNQVQLCDRVGAGSGKLEHGRGILREMVNQGHELANEGWYENSSKLNPADLERQLLACGQLLSEARHAALDRGEEDSITYRRRRWFRPGSSIFNQQTLQVARKHGYIVALGSVWPWDTYISWPLLNAIYIWSKVYSGAVIVLHDRHESTLSTLSYVLPWLKWWGYSITTLSEAHQLSDAGGTLTAEALALHNQMFAAEDGSMGDKEALKALLSYDARMSKERERAATLAAAEEEERRRLRAEKFAAMDRRAGIDRKLVDMSAAEKRSIARKEREKKEAERRRIKRAAEKIKAQERHEAYMREMAIRAKEEADKAAARKKFEEQEKMRQEKQREELRAKREAERALLARLREERLAREAEEERAAAAAALLAPPEPEEPVKKSKGMVGKMKSKILKQLGLKKTKTAAAAAATAAAAAVAVAAGDDEEETPSGEYGWYGQEPTEQQKAAVAAIDAAIAQQRMAAAGADGDDDESSPTISGYATGADGLPLIGFDARPLLLGSTADGTPLVLGSNGELLLGPGGEQIVLVLDAQQKPMVDPMGRPVMLAVEVLDNQQQQQKWVETDGSISGPMSATSTAVGEVEQIQQQGAAVVVVAAAAGAEGGLLAAEVGAEGKTHYQNPAAAAAAELSRESAFEFEAAEGYGAVDADTPAAAAGIFTASPTGRTRAASATGDISDTVTGVDAGVFEMDQRSADAPAAPPPAGATPAGNVYRVPRQFAVHPDGSLVLNSAGQRATLVLGPDGSPVLGHDFRPLVIAEDEEGRVLHFGLNQEHQLIGPDGQKLLLAVTSEGLLVALTAECNMFTTGDGTPLLVPLDHYGMPMLDPTTHQVLLLDPKTQPPLGATTSYASSISYAEVRGDMLLPPHKLQQQAVALEQQELQQQAAELLLPPTVPSTPVPSLPPTPKLAGRHAANGAMSATGLGAASAAYGSGTCTHGWGTPKKAGGTATPSGTATPRAAPATPRSTTAAAAGAVRRSFAPSEGAVTPHTTTPSPSAGSPRRGSPTAVAAGAGAAATAVAGTASGWAWHPQAAPSHHRDDQLHSRSGANRDVSALASTHNLLASRSTLGSSGVLSMSAGEPLGPGTSPTAGLAAAGAAASPFASAPAGAAGVGIMQQGSVGTRGNNSSSLHLLGLDYEPRSAAADDDRVAMIVGGSPTADYAATKQQQQQGSMESVFDQEHIHSQPQQQEHVQRPEEQDLGNNSSNKAAEGAHVMNVLATPPRAGDLIRPDHI